MLRILTCCLALCLSGTVAIAAPVGERITINGYSSFEFERHIGHHAHGAHDDPDGSFDADLFDLVFGIQATDRLRVVADITWEHGAATEDGRGNVAVEYAFPEYTIQNWLRIRAGKMFVPFGIYNEIHTAKPAFLTVKEPLSTNKNHKFGSDQRFYPRWATGLAVLGTGMHGRTNFDYILQVSNGEQEQTNPHEEDDNRQKALAGRLRASPIPDLWFGASFYTDRLTELDSLGKDSGDRTRLWSYGTSIEGTVGSSGFECEYVEGTITPTTGDDLKRRAFTAMVYYVIRETLTPYFRVEWLDPDTAIRNDRAMMFIYGLNIQIDDGLFIKAEFDTVDSESNNSRFGNDRFTELKAAIAVGF